MRTTDLPRPKTVAEWLVAAFGLQLVLPIALARLSRAAGQRDDEDCGRAPEPR